MTGARPKAAISLRRAGALHLHDAIKAYCAEQPSKPDEQARALLARLAKDSDAAKALGRLELTDRSAEAVIVRACVEAENLARTFRQRIAKAEAMLAQKKPLTESVAKLRRFVDELTADRKKPSDQLCLRELYRPIDIHAMRRGLVQIERAIWSEQHLAELNLSRLWATRKSRVEAAGRIAAVKLLASEVKRATAEARREMPACMKEAYDKEVAALATATLGRDISLDQVRAARRARGHWYWVVRSLPAARPRRK